MTMEPATTLDWDRKEGGDNSSPFLLFIFLLYILVSINNKYGFTIRNYNR